MCHAWYCDFGTFLQLCLPRTFMLFVWDRHQRQKIQISPLLRSWFSPRTSVLSVLKRLEDKNVTAIERRIATCPKKLQLCMNITELLPSDLTRNSTTKGHASPLYFTYYSTAVMYSWSIPSMWTIGVCRFSFNSHLFLMSNVRQLYINLDACEEAICLRGSCALFKQAGDNQFVLNSQQLALMYHWRLRPKKLDLFEDNVSSQQCTWL